MFILQIGHRVLDFDAWKKTFDSDPLHRRDSGVRSYRLFKGIGDPNYIIVELEFDNLPEAETMHENLKQLWPKVEGKVITGPKSRIIETFESVEYNR